MVHSLLRKGENVRWRGLAAILCVQLGNLCIVRKVDTDVHLHALLITQHSLHALTSGFDFLGAPLRRANLDQHGHIRSVCQFIGCASFAQRSNVVTLLVSEITLVLLNGTRHP